MWRVVAWLWLPALALCEFVIEDDQFGQGPETVRLKVLRNLETGEYVSVAWNCGGRLEDLYLLVPGTGVLRKVLDDHDRNASAVRANLHWKGAQLMPYANRIAGATYVFNGTRYRLPMNEPARNNSIHGLLWNKVMTIVEAQPSVENATVILGYDFDGREQGYPFLLGVFIQITLTRGGLVIRNSAYNNERTWPLPFYNSLHFYFNAEVYKATLVLDRCTAWAHLSMPNNSNLYSNLIPTGAATPWTAFQGGRPIGGTAAAPTYYDDEFKALDPDACNGFHTRLRDPASGSTTVLWSDNNYPFVQVFTGARSLWGSDAVAIEPMSAMANAYNNGDHLRILSAGERFVSEFGVYLESNDP